MQIGALQDEEEEGVASAPDDAPESFAHSVLGKNKFKEHSYAHTDAPIIMVISVYFWNYIWPTGTTVRDLKTNF